MLGVKTNKRTKQKNLARLFSDVLIFDSKHGILKCHVCDKKLNAIYKSNVEDHVQGRVHSILFEKNKLLEEKENNPLNNKKKMCEMWSRAFSSSNIPLNTFKSSGISCILGELNINVPSVNTLRKKIFNDFSQLIEELKEKWYEKDLFFILDETKKHGKKYFGIIAGTLIDPLEKYLIYLDIGDYKCDSIFVLDSIYKALKEVNSRPSYLKLVVADGVSYNTKAKKEIQLKYEHVTWVSCYAHLLHNFSEKIMLYYNNVSEFIFKMNDLFANNTNFNYLFKNYKKPPSVCKTR